jgi:nucleoside-diphosphate-sugar epimerase
LACADEVRRLERRLRGGGVWLIAAARTPEHAGPQEDNMAANIALARNLAALLARLNPSHVIFLSSIDVYGRTGLQLPLDEDSPMRPQSPYAASKCASEGILSDACGELGIPLTTLRLPGVYGPGDPHHGPVRSFVEAAVQRRDIHVHGNGQQRRDLLFVRDMPRIVEALSAVPVPGVFNAVTGRSLSLNGMLGLIEKLAGEKLRVHYHEESAQIDLDFKPPRLLCRMPALKLAPLEAGILETYTWENGKRKV